MSRAFKEILVIVLAISLAAGTLFIAVSSYHSHQNEEKRKLARECFASNERIAALNSRVFVPECDIR